VPVTSIGARCRRCGKDFRLFEVRDQRSGTCPRCGRTLTADWTAMLLDEAARAEVAQRHLMQALRRLRELPGNLAIRPHTVLRPPLQGDRLARGLGRGP
jgi:RNA polymerase subunit RPABC4/transcription elongation factor Spt4